MKVLVTGGAGYIGSHTCVELLNSGYEVIVVDNLMNSKEESLKRVQEITGKPLKFHELDLIDKKALNEIFENEKPSAVIHFAGLKAVGESVKKPLLYYRNNLISTIHLLEVMNDHAVKTIIFSSSATVYGEPKSVPITEDFDVHPTSPYGRTKLMLEEILTDVATATPDLSVTLLRYFNPVGAHESGRIGEDPTGIPNNLMPYISQVAVGKLSKLSIFGGDWPTPDGTGIRDYIHVVDLAQGHVTALKKMHEKSGVHTFNLGRGKGVSVLELVKAFEEATGKNILYEIVGRRPGDIAECYADSSKAQQELGWSASKSVTDMCKDSWKWQSQNPNGY